MHPLRTVQSASPCHPFPLIANGGPLADADQERCQTFRAAAPTRALHFAAPGRGRRFTLIEMLVVIAIIAILAAMLSPALMKALSRARQIQCMGNVKNLIVASLSYASDYDQYVPNGVGFGLNDVNGGYNPGITSGAQTFWKVLLAPYLGIDASLRAWTTDEFNSILISGKLTNNAMYHCPETAPQYELYYDKFLQSYGMAMVYHPDNWYQRYKYSQIRKKPYSEVMMYGDAIGPNHVIPGLSSSGLTSSVLWRSNNVWYRVHGDGINVSWADGHVSLMTDFQLKTDPRNRGGAYWWLLNNEQ